MFLMRMWTYTETTRAEVARAKPAILAASEHFPTKSLKSEWMEQVSLAGEDSRPEDLPTVWLDRRWTLREGEEVAIFAGWRKVAVVALREVAITPSL